MVDPAFGSYHDGLDCAAGAAVAVESALGPDSVMMLACAADVVAVVKSEIAVVGAADLSVAAVSAAHTQGESGAGEGIHRWPASSGT